MVYTTALSTSAPLIFPSTGAVTATGQPKPGSIDETIAMFDSISRQVLVEGNRFNAVSFRDLVFPASEGQPDYKRKKDRYDTFFNRLKLYEHVAYGKNIDVDYTIIHKQGEEGYLLIGNSPFVPGEKPNYSFTYYLEDLRFSNPNGSPNFMLAYNGNSDGSAFGLLNRNIDPVEKLGLSLIREEEKFTAKQEYGELLQWIRQLYIATRGRSALRMRRQRKKSLAP